MDERTREYLRGRFGDHYRRSEIDLPPAPERREWGHIPFTAGAGTTMIRHQSVLDLGAVSDFLARERPRHVYFSAGRYDDPGADSMAGKGWQGSDLIFDLDADHLPGVDPVRDGYAAMLERCKEELFDLLDILEADFGFGDPLIVFSGGRGYHVHVRKEGIRSLDSERRGEIADYVRGADLAEEAYVRTVSRGGVNRRVLATDGGWGRRIHGRLLEVVDELRAAEEEAALERLQAYEGIGTGRAGKILETAVERREAVAAGDLELGGTGMRRLVKLLAEEVRAEQGAHVDEPVTTDTNRLIRLPGSLHGGTGLAVTRIERDDLPEFDPLTDAVPATFREQAVRIEVPEGAGGGTPFEGGSFTVNEGITSVPEYVAVFLLARGRASKAPES
jgi:DNA primase small subunit